MGSTKEVITEDGDTSPKFEARRYHIDTWDLAESRYCARYKEQKQLKKYLKSRVGCDWNKTFSYICKKWNWEIRSKVEFYVDLGAYPRLSKYCEFYVKNGILYQTPKTKHKPIVKDLTYIFLSNTTDLIKIDGIWYSVEWILCKINRDDSYYTNQLDNRYLLGQSTRCVIDNEISRKWFWKITKRKQLNTKMLRKYNLSNDINIK